MRSYRSMICYRIESLLWSSQWHFNPFSILIDECSWTPNWKSASESRIRAQEAIYSRVIAGRYAPLVIFADEILLHHDLAIGFEWLRDVTVHRRICDSDIPRRVDCADFD